MKSRYPCIIKKANGIEVSELLAAANGGDIGGMNIACSGSAGKFWV